MEAQFLTMLMVLCLQSDRGFCTVDGAFDNNYETKQNLKTAAAKQQLLIIQLRCQAVGDKTDAPNCRRIQI